jgi:hypothetical protein
VPNPHLALRALASTRVLNTNTKAKRPLLEDRAEVIFMEEQPGCVVVEIFKEMRIFLNSSTFKSNKKTRGRIVQRSHDTPSRFA